MKPGEKKMADLIVPVSLRPGENPGDILESDSCGGLVKILAALPSHGTRMPPADDVLALFIASRLLKVEERDAITDLTSQEASPQRLGRPAESSDMSSARWGNRTADKDGPMCHVQPRATA